MHFAVLKQRWSIASTRAKEKYQLDLKWLVHDIISGTNPIMKDIGRAVIHSEKPTHCCVIKEAC